MRGREGGSADGRLPLLSDCFSTLGEILKGAVDALTNTDIAVGENHGELGITIGDAEF
jgi:hypothetical protein